MTLDKFGRSSKQTYKIIKTTSGISITQNENGDFDMQNKILVNLKSPENEADAVNRLYLDKKINQLTEEYKIFRNEVMNNQFENLNNKVDKLFEEYEIFKNEIISQQFNKKLDQLFENNKIFISEVKSSNRTFTIFKADMQKELLDIKRSFMVHINNLETKQKELYEQWENMKS